MNFLKDLFYFFKERKKWWLMPIVLILIMLGILISLTESSTITPFIYSIF